MDSEWIRARINSVPVRSVKLCQSTTGGSNREAAQAVARQAGQRRSSRPQSERIGQRDGIQTAHVQSRLESQVPSCQQASYQSGTNLAKSLNKSEPSLAASRQEASGVSRLVGQAEAFSQSISSSSSSYVTAPINFRGSSSPSSILNDDLTSSASVYVTPKSHLTGSLNLASSNSTLHGESSEIEPEQELKQDTSKMVSYTASQNFQPISTRALAASSDTDTPTMTPNTEELEDPDDPMNPTASFTSAAGRPAYGALYAASSLQTATDEEDLIEEHQIGCESELDAEQLRRILGHKRLSDGCVSRIASSLVTRKNSLHMIEEMPPLTEGEAMKHMSYHGSTFEPLSVASSGSSGSLRSAGGRMVAQLALKRASQDDNTTSCSSTTSLEKSSPSHNGRRRSSTISQCSSVLSEGTRNQLNFDLSPDLAPDSSLLEANAISPTDLDRPASPEPFSDASPLSPEEARPMSQMSLQNDELMLASPDSTLGDSNDNHHLVDLVANRQELGRLERLTHSYAHGQDPTTCCLSASGSNPISEMQISPDSNQAIDAPEVSGETDASARADPSLERLITDVNEVSVSPMTRTCSSKRPASDDSNPVDLELLVSSKGIKTSLATSRLPRPSSSLASAETFSSRVSTSSYPEARSASMCSSSSSSSGARIGRTSSVSRASGTMRTNPLINKNGKLDNRH